MPKPLKPEILERMAAMLRLLAHPQRLQVIEFLDGVGEAPVNAIVEHLGVPQATASNHLVQMKRIGLIKSVRKGRQIWYAIADPRSLTILECIRSKGDKV